MAPPPVEAAPLVDDALADAFRRAWPDALAVWSRYTQLRPPILLTDEETARGLAMEGQIASIRLRDQTVSVNLLEVRRRGLERFALPLLAHEIGHHVYVPGSAVDHGRMMAAMRRVLSSLPPSTVAMVGNLWGDLLINDRLQRRAGLDLAGIYRALRSTGDGAPSAVWQVYLRAFEELWRLPRGELCGDLPPKNVGARVSEMEGDALLIARIARSYAGEFVRGARRFAVVLYRWLAEDAQREIGAALVASGLSDTRDAAQPAPGEGASDAIPDGLVAIDEAEEGGDDDDLDGGPLRGPKAKRPDGAPEGTSRGTPGQNARTPFEFGQLLRALGLDLADHDVTARYYRERALPHLLPFPTRRAPRKVEPLIEGQAPWEIGDPLEALDLFGSLTTSPRLIPGVTTLQPVYGESPGGDPARVPLDLDLYVDSSGSMPDPQVDVSWLALAGTILALSALRAGARVQATLWSGPNQFETTGGFVTDEQRLLRVITGHFGGSTAFPLHVLRETFAGARPRDASPAHVVVISDDGVDTMLATDERDQPGAAVCAAALASARGGGTLVLNLPAYEGYQLAAQPELERIGFTVATVRAWADLVAFARDFARRLWEAP